MGVLLGINKVALRYQWAPYVHLGPCHDLGPLWLFLSTPDQMARLPGSQVRCTHPPTLPPTHPPTTTLPSPSYPPTHPLYTTHDIAETFQKTFTKPVILTSCQLCSYYNVSYNTSLLLEQVWHGYNQAPEKYSDVNTKIGISRNTKCAIWNGFPKSSHI